MRDLAVTDGISTISKNERPLLRESSGTPDICRPSSPVRIVLTKMGLDGHDRGIKVVARGLRDEGFHVIYGGIWQSPAAALQAVVDEDAHWLGISLLNGAHLTLMQPMLAKMRRCGLHDIGVVLGGIIPEKDFAKLQEMGVAGIFGPGTSIAQIAQFLQSSGKTVRTNRGNWEGLSRKSDREIGKPLCVSSPG